MGAGRIGQECLQEQLGLFKSMCRKAQDWSGVYVKVGGIGRDWLRVSMSGSDQIFCCWAGMQTTNIDLCYPIDFYNTHSVIPHCTRALHLLEYTDGGSYTANITNLIKKHLTEIYF